MQAIDTDRTVEDLFDEKGISTDRLNDPDPPEAPDPDDIPGKNSVDLTREFGEGELRREGDCYVLKGATKNGYRIGTVVDTVKFEFIDMSPDSEQAVNYLDVTGLEFKLNDGRLDLRRPPEQ